MTNDRLKLIEEMLATNSDDSFLQYAAALEYEKGGETQRAIITIQKLLDRDPEYIGAYYKLGKLLEEKEKTDQAIEVYKRGLVIARKRKDVKVQGEITEALMILGADDENTWS